jgi:hypothetical protein
MKKDPSLLKPTEITVTYRDTLIVKDTVFIEGVDTSIVFDLDSLQAFRLNDSTTINLLRQQNGKLRLEVLRKAKTIIKEIEVPFEVQVPCNCPPQLVCGLTRWEKFFISAGQFLLAVLVLAIIFVAYKRK